MISLINRSGIGLLVLSLVFCLFGSMASASKLEIYELSQRIREVQTKIDQAYEQLRKLNEEGGEQAQEEAQLLMALIKELKAEKQGLEKSMDKLKKGISSNNHNKPADAQDFYRDAERLEKLNKR